MLQYFGVRACLGPLNPVWSGLWHARRPFNQPPPPPASPALVIHINESNHAGNQGKHSIYFVLCVCERVASRCPHHRDVHEWRTGIDVLFKDKLSFVPKGLRCYRREYWWMKPGGPKYREPASKKEPEWIFFYLTRRKPHRALTSKCCCQEGLFAWCCLQVQLFVFKRSKVYAKANKLAPS